MKLKPVSEVAKELYTRCRNTAELNTRNAWVFLNKDIQKALTQDRLETYKAIEGIIEGMWVSEDLASGAKNQTLTTLQQELKTLFNINE